MSDKSGYSNQSQYKREKAIKERIINALLDFSILENHLDEDQRKDIFEYFDANKIFEKELELPSSKTNHVGCITDTISFIYRETKKNTGFHPPFAMSLEHGIVQGEFEPRTSYYGNYEIDISFERLPESKVNMKSVTERIKNGDHDSLNEAEMRSVIEILARSDSADPSSLEDEFNEWVDEFEEENERQPMNLGEIFSQKDHGEPHRWIVED
ncbi:hypothetical protein C440_07952 [Haloferax mucosum ATCC BAA-1512]|uniref:Domain of unknown function domain-containing protein n=1 Tax=Haloferax mucosum ATCC BAA-1512 TaxID=662479 RepID=M0IGP8_9EURY|nr:hypothetical protein [Haloferax mucosum]ELZ94993.1 hypothetical protein C440_07952 [Haloferax mucosum ATCC BAA-1512]